MKLWYDIDIQAVYLDGVTLPTQGCKHFRKLWYDIDIQAVSLEEVTSPLP